MSSYLYAVYQVSKATPRLPRATLPGGHGAMREASRLQCLYHDQSFTGTSLQNGPA
jgi:hypothetical protein